MKVNIAQLYARMASGEPTEEDLDQAAALTKSLAAGELTAADLDGIPELKKSLGVKDDCDSDEDTEPDDDEDDTPPAAPVKKAVEEIETVESQMRRDPESNRAINAVPALQIIVKSLDAIRAELRDVSAQQEQLIAENGELKKSLATAMQRPAAIPKQVAADTGEALLKALETSGLVGRLGRLEDIVDRRPHTTNPPRSREVQAAGGTGDISKSKAITIIQKSLTLNRLTTDDAQNALAQIDLVDGARRRGNTELTFEKVVKNFDPHTLKEFMG